MSDPDIHHHAILEKPWTYEVLGFSYRYNSQDQRACELDLVLKKNESNVTLRFYGVHMLSVTSDDLGRGQGLQILDEAARGLEQSRIRAVSYTHLVLQIVLVLCSLLLSFADHALPIVAALLAFASMLAGACAALLGVLLAVRTASMAWGCLPIVALALGFVGFIASAVCCVRGA